MYEVRNVLKNTWSFKHSKGWKTQEILKNTRSFKYAETRIFITKPSSSSEELPVSFLTKRKKREWKLLSFFRFICSSMLRQYANNKCCLFITPRFDWMKSSMSWCVKFARCGLGTMAVGKNTYEQSNTAYERGRNNYFPLAKFVLNDDSLSYSLSFIFIHLLHK